MQKQIDKAKSDKDKKKYTAIQKEYIREIRKHTRNLEQIIKFQHLRVEAKSVIVNKLDQVKSLWQGKRWSGVWNDPK